MTPLMILVSMRLRTSVFPASWDAQQQAALLAGVVEEDVTGVRVVKGFGQEAREIARLDTRQSTLEAEMADKAADFAAVAKLDVARSAAAVLRDPAAHAGRIYDMTGPEALSFAEIVETLSAAAGRRIRYLDETVEEARRSRAHFNAPGWQIEGWITTYTAIAEGRFARVSGDVELLTGSRPISLRELLVH